jgi:hypothetical protein
VIITRTLWWFSPTDTHSGSQSAEQQYEDSQGISSYQPHLPDLQTQEEIVGTRVTTGRRWGSTEGGKVTIDAATEQKKDNMNEFAIMLEKSWNKIWLKLNIERRKHRFVYS